MPANEISIRKRSTNNDSNIPILKKNQSKPSKRKEFPDLQKYIETIIKASKDYENVTTRSDFASSLRTDNSPVGFAVGGENPIKFQNARFDESNSIDSIIKMNSDFLRENQRRETDSNPSLEIQKFLKKLYPNPYCLEKRKSSTDLEDDLSKIIVRKTKGENNKSEDSLVESSGGKKSNPANLEWNPANESAQIFRIQHKKLVRSKLKNNRQITTISNGNPECNLGNLKFLYVVDCSESKNSNFDLETFRRRRKQSAIGWKSSRESDFSMELRKLRMIENQKVLNSSDLEFSTMKKSHRELKKLYEIMDKTNESILAISSRNERELMEKERRRRTGRQNYTFYKFENSKFVQLIKKISAKKSEESKRLEEDGRNPNGFDSSCSGSETCIWKKGKENPKCDFPAVRATAEKDCDSPRVHWVDAMREKMGGKKISGRICDEATVAATVAKKKIKFKNSGSQNKEINSGTSRGKGGKRSDSPNDLELRNIDNQFSKKESELFNANNKIDDLIESMQEYLKKFNRDRKSLERTPEEEEEEEEGIPTEKTETESESRKSDVETVDGGRINSKPEVNNDWGKRKMNSDRRIIETGEASGSRSGLSKEINQVFLIPEREDEPTISTHSNQSSATHQGRTINGNVAPERIPLQSDEVPVPEGRFHMAEENNELGGYNEEKPEGITSGAAGNSTKNLLPLSVRIRKKKSDSSKALKKALEREEVLILDRFLGFRGPSSDPFLMANLMENRDFFSSARRRQFWGLRPTETNFFFKRKTFPIETIAMLKKYKSKNSNFVVCVNSLPRNFRPAKKDPSPPVSFTETKRYQKLDSPQRVSRCLSRRSIAMPEIAHTASTYGLSEKMIAPIFEAKKADVLHEAASIGMRFVRRFSESKEGHSMEETECPITYKLIPLKKSLFVDSTSTPFPVPPARVPEEKEIRFENLQVLDSFHGTVNDSSVTSEDTKFSQVTSLGDEEVEEAGETIDGMEDMKVEDISSRTGKSLASTHSTGELFAISNSNNENNNGSNSGSNDRLVIPETEEDKKKVQFLLMRTYSIQRKLHRYMEKLSFLQPFSTSVPYIFSKSLSDIYVPEKAKKEPEELSSSPDGKPNGSIDINSKSMQTDDSRCFLYWHVTPDSNFRSRSTNILNSSSIRDFKPEMEKVDQGISYLSIAGKKDSFPEGKKTRNDSSRAGEVGGVNEVDEEVDDRSSISSFKSSISESNECNRSGRDEKSVKSGESKKFNFLKKIFSDLEKIRKSFKRERKKGKSGEKRQEAGNAILRSAGNDLEKSTGSSIMERSCLKKPAKILKTVFKGKNSMTELAIGLKDVPMNNISVERKKFSSNHTKISISISKQKSPEEDQSNRLPRDSDIKESEKECENSRDNFPKKDQSSQGSRREKNDEFVEEEEDEEDDFKSVGSSLSSDSDCGSASIEYGKKSGGTAIEKERFDIRRKTGSHRQKIDSGGERPPLGRYQSNRSVCRRIEPVTQALTDVQIRMKRTNRNTLLMSNEYYERALKLAKMSAGFCQNCGNRAVIPDDPFGCYRSVLPRRYSSHHLKYFLTRDGSADSSFYSFRSSTELSDPFKDLEENRKSSTYLIDPPLLNGSLNNVSFCYERI